MKKIAILSIMLICILFTSCNKESDLGTFSISKNKKIKFAPANLIYNNGKYGFATQQYDYGDYFIWGNGENPNGIPNYLMDYYVFDDWGKYIEGEYRTLSPNEWMYVINERPNAQYKRGPAKVCGVAGMLLLPDNWEGNSIIGFSKNKDYGKVSSWSDNSFNADEWRIMESHGAVFLPASGRSQNGEVNDVGERGFYWSNYRVDWNDVYYIYFDNTCVITDFYEEDDLYEDYCYPVRLVQDYHKYKFKLSPERRRWAIKR